MVAAPHVAAAGPGVGQEDGGQGQPVPRLVAVPEPGVVAAQKLDVLHQFGRAGQTGWQLHRVVLQLVPVRPRQGFNTNWPPLETTRYL